MIASARHIRRPRPALGRAQGHCGELLQGRLGPEGPVALVTLPWPELQAHAWFAPSPNAPLLVRVRGTGAHPPEVARRAANAALAALGAKGWGGRLMLTNPAPVGGGAGSSSMDALATIRAVAASFGASFGPDREASLMLDAEGAVDPLMHVSPVLFASREARVLARLPRAPKMLAFGGFDGPGRRTAAADPSDLDVRELAARLSSALDAGDLSEIGAIASASAESDQAKNPKPRWAEIKALAKEVGGLGVSVSHSGSAVALLFPPDAQAVTRRAAAGLDELGVRSTRLFRPFG